MHFRWLNLDRRPDRRQAFLANNGHTLNQSCLHSRGRVPCIDGPQLGRDGLAAHGVVAADLPFYSLGSIGNQLTHHGQWALATTRVQPTMICEDDAILHPRFRSQWRPILEQLPLDWDIVFWGWSYRCWMSFEFVPGSRSLLGAASNEQQPQQTAAFIDHPYDAQVFRCWGAWNSFAYTVSPAGAARLLEYCWPLKHEAGQIPQRAENFAIYGVDAKLAALTPALSAWITFPPLAYHPHDLADSDMLPDGSPIRDTREGGAQ